MTTKNINWHFTNPFIIDITVTAEDIDSLGHANNVVYLKWMEKVAWANSKFKGIDLEKFRELDRAMVATHHEMDYFAPSFINEELQVATWIVQNDGRVKIERCYQIVRVADGVTLLRGRSTWVCVSYLTGRAKKMPDEFIRAYAVTVI